MSAAILISNREDARDAVGQKECVRCVLLALTLCGAALNSKSIEFARAIADVLIWSAEHARGSAVHTQEQIEHPEWQCGTCGESVPNNFDLCWNCEADRNEDRFETGATLT